MYHDGYDHGRGVPSTDDKSSLYGISSLEDNLGGTWLYLEKNLFISYIFRIYINVI